MRADMHRVVDERPRKNRSPVYTKREANLDPDLLPRRQSMGRLGSYPGVRGGLTGPLRRWLRSRVGRPWNEVYSEACTVINTNSDSQRYLKLHLLQMVHRNTFLRGGGVWCFGHVDRNESGGPIPVEEAVSRDTPYYIHPETGRLSEAFDPEGRPCAYKKKNSSWSRPKMPGELWLDKKTLLLFIDGWWYRCTLEGFPDMESHFDRAVMRLINRREAYWRYGKAMYCRFRRTLSRAEVAAYGLKKPASAAAGSPARAFACRERPGRIFERMPPVHRPSLNHLVSRGPVSPARSTAATQHGGVMQNQDHHHDDQPTFEITSKRRKGFPSETQVKRGDRVVHGDKELLEKLGRNDLCPCGSSRKFPRLLPRLRPV